MRHARKDYNRIQDPQNKIPVLEPVFLLRGQDKYAAETVLFYAQSILDDELASDAAREIAQRTWDWAKEMREWGEHIGVKQPDMPEGA